MFIDRLLSASRLIAVDKQLWLTNHEWLEISVECVSLVRSRGFSMNSRNSHFAIRGPKCSQFFLLLWGKVIMVGESLHSGTNAWSRGQIIDIDNYKRFIYAYGSDFDSSFLENYSTWFETTYTFERWEINHYASSPGMTDIGMVTSFPIWVVARTIYIVGCPLWLE